MSHGFPAKNLRQDKSLSSRSVGEAAQVCLELRRPNLNRQLVEFAGEAKRHLVIFIIDRRAGVDAHVEGLVDRRYEGDGVRDRLFGNLGAIDAQDTGAAFGEARPIVGEIKNDAVLARRQCLSAFPAEALQSQQVVSEHWLALQHIKAIATKPAAERVENAFPAALRNLDVGRDRIRLSQDAGRRAWQAGQTARRCR